MVEEGTDTIIKNIRDNTSPLVDLINEKINSGIRDMIVEERYKVFEGYINDQKKIYPNMVVDIDGAFEPLKNIYNLYASKFGLEEKNDNVLGYAVVDVSETNLGESEEDVDSSLNEYIEDKLKSDEPEKDEETETSRVRSSFLQRHPWLKKTVIGGVTAGILVGAVGLYGFFKKDDNGVKDIKPATSIEQIVTDYNSNVRDCNNNPFAGVNLKKVTDAGYGCNADNGFYTKKKAPQFTAKEPATDKETKGFKIHLNHYFDSTKLKSNSKKALDDLIKILPKNAKLALFGYASEDGGTNHNLILSGGGNDLPGGDRVGRAEAIENYIKSKRPDVTFTHVEGHGETSRFANNWQGNRNTVVAADSCGLTNDTIKAVPELDTVYGCDESVELKKKKTRRRIAKVKPKPKPPIVKEEKDKTQKEKDKPPVFEEKKDKPPVFEEDKDVHVFDRPKYEDVKHPNGLEEKVGQRIPKPPVSLIDGEIDKRVSWDYNKKLKEGEEIDVYVTHDKRFDPDPTGKLIIIDNYGNVVGETKITDIDKSTDLGKGRVKDTYRGKIGGLPDGYKVKYVNGKPVVVEKIKTLEEGYEKKVDKKGRRTIFKANHKAKPGINFEPKKDGKEDKQSKVEEKISIAKFVGEFIFGTDAEAAGFGDALFAEYITGEEVNIEDMFNDMRIPDAPGVTKKPKPIIKSEEEEFVEEEPKNEEENSTIGKVSEKITARAEYIQGNTSMKDVSTIDGDESKWDGDITGYAGELGININEKLSLRGSYRVMNIKTALETMVSDGSFEKEINAVGPGFDGKIGNYFIRGDVLFKESKAEQCYDSPDICAKQKSKGTLFEALVENRKLLDGDVIDLGLKATLLHDAQKTRQDVFVNGILDSTLGKSGKDAYSVFGGGITGDVSTDTLNFKTDLGFIMREKTDFKEDRDLSGQGIVGNLRVGDNTYLIGSWEIPLNSDEGISTTQWNIGVGQDRLRIGKFLNSVMLPGWDLGLWKFEQKTYREDDVFERSDFGVMFSVKWNVYYDMLLDSLRETN